MNIAKNLQIQKLSKFGSLKYLTKRKDKIQLISRIDIGRFFLIKIYFFVKT